MLGLINLARPQIAHKKLVAAKDLQKQKAVVSIIAAEEATFLSAMHRIVRGIEVENQRIGWLVTGGNELLEQQFVDVDGDLTINAILQTTKRRLTPSDFYRSTELYKVKSSQAKPRSNSTFIKIEYPNDTGFALIFY
jgi:hypothetical protein